MFAFDFDWFCFRRDSSDLVVSVLKVNPVVSSADDHLFKIRKCFDLSLCILDIFLDLLDSRLVFTARIEHLAKGFLSWVHCANVRIERLGDAETDFFFDTREVPFAV